MTTYNRKYYLIRKLKADGWKLLLKDGQRTIVIPSDKIKEADDNQIIWELMNEYGFGAQIKKNLPEVAVNGIEPLKDSIPASKISYFQNGKEIHGMPFSNEPLGINLELFWRTDGEERLRINALPSEYNHQGKEVSPERKLPLFKRILNKLYAR
jgi:hypothetical protein